MPSEYDSTARALAAPIPSPPLSPTGFEPVRPSVDGRRSTSGRPRSMSPRTAHGGFTGQVLHSAMKIQRHAIQTIKRMSWFQRILTMFAIVATMVLGILFLVFNERIFGWLVPVADNWRKIPAGWLILWAMTFVCAFPPVIGYSTCVTIAGFVYGFPNGWFIASTATIIGSLCSFLLSRTLLSGFVHRLVENDKRFAALALTLKHDGLKLLCMIRLCPLPYSISNGALSTFPTLHPLMFTLATAIASPKLLIHVFIGSRLESLAEGGEKMDATTRAVNYASIAGGALVGFLTGLFIFRRTMARSRQIEAEERAQARTAAAEGETPDTFADDPSEVDAAATLMRDEDDISLRDNAYGDAYHDDPTEVDGPDVFDTGDGDEEEEIGMGRRGVLK